MDQMAIGSSPGSAGSCARQFQAAVTRCYEDQESRDIQYLMTECGRSGVEKAFEQLERIIPLDNRNFLSMITLSLPSFARLESLLQGRGAQYAATTIMWSMLNLILQESAGDKLALSHFAPTVKEFHHQISLFSTYCSNAPSLPLVEEAAVDIFVELINFEQSCIKFLRITTALGRASENRWQDFVTGTNAVKTSLMNVLERVEKHVRFAHHVEEMQRLQILLSLAPNSPNGQANLPFSNLPVSKNARFFDRDDIIKRIDDHFNNKQGSEGFRSFVLYGLGGVGKSHVALRYAYGKVASFPAVLWIKSETAESLAQSFSEAAVRLKLRGAELSKHEENRILLLDWLQKTPHQWLLVYDNAESFDLLLKYWPVANQGCALITTRNHTFAYEPADIGIEVLPFDRETGSAFILHLLSLDIAESISSQDVKSSLELSDKLSGHALAISQMTGLIYKRSWSISEFLAIYDRNTRHIHDMKGTNSLDAIWRLSFQSLNQGCPDMLGIMCYLAPDSIPQALFEQSPEHDLPPELRYCSNELLLSEVIDELLALALIKREKPTRLLSLHRLVQQQFRFFSSPTDNQRFFDNTSYLLFEAFPQSDAKKGQLYDRWTECQQYLQHAISLRDQYKQATESEDPLRPSLKFCRLLKNLARFLLESASYKEVQETLCVAVSAFKKLKPEDYDQCLYADLCGSSGLAYAHQGFFTAARPWLEQAHKIRAEAKPLDRLELSWTEVNLGNLEAASSNYRASLDWHTKALQSRQIAVGDEITTMHPQAVIYQNLGRSSYLVGDFLEAHVWCHLAVSLLSETQNWAMLAYTHFVLGNAYRAEGKVAEAEAEYFCARQVWLDKGQILTHHFNGACMYKLGCTAFDKGCVETSINQLQESLVITKLHKDALAGDYARVLYKLSVVLGSREENKTEAAAKMLEAEAIARSRLGLEADAAVAQEEQTYDGLVYILWR